MAILVTGAVVPRQVKYGTVDGVFKNVDILAFRLYIVVMGTTNRYKS